MIHTNHQKRANVDGARSNHNPTRCLSPTTGRRVNDYTREKGAPRVRAGSLVDHFTNQFQEFTYYFSYQDVQVFCFTRVWSPPRSSSSFNRIAACHLAARQ